MDLTAACPPEQRHWQRSSMHAEPAWVLVDVQLPAGGGEVARTSHRSRRGRTPVRWRGRTDRAGWIWRIRWYRARWAASRAFRSRRSAD